MKITGNFFQMEEFKEETLKNFRVEANFDYEASITPDLLVNYASLIKKHVFSEGFLHFDIR
jgi:hypothetical protein